MQQEQFSQLLSVLEKLTISNQYTLTGAADWPILAALGAIIFTLIVYVWYDLKATIKTDRTDSYIKIKEIEEKHERDMEKIWQAQKDCQHECCPRLKEKN